MLTLPYMRNDSMTSGARYHRVATSGISPTAQRGRSIRTLREALLFWIGGLDGLGRSCKTKVADFQVAIGVEQQVRWLQVSVDDCYQPGFEALARVLLRLTLGRMQRFERTARLVEEVLAVVVAKILSADDSVQVGLEQFLHQVDCLQLDLVEVRRGSPSLNESYDTGLMMSNTEMICGQ